MKLKPSIKFYFTIYFLILMVLFHREVKYYYYWKHIARLQHTIFDFHIDRFLIVLPLFFINLWLLFKINTERLLFTITAFFFMVLTVPSLIGFTAGKIYPAHLLWYHQLLFITLLLSSKIKINLSKLPVLNKEHALYLLVVITCVGILPYLIIWGPYINLNNLLLKDIYETREAMTKVGNSYFGYTFSLFSKIIIPLIIVFSLELKKYYLTLLGVFFLVLFYLFGGHKTVYAGLILVFVFYKLSYFRAVQKTLKWSNILIVLSLTMAYFGYQYDYLWILTFRRTHFLPGLLDIAYLDFFQNQPIYWSESVLKRFISYPFDASHVSLIGENYFGKADMGANNGLISDGYMNFKTIGVFINVFIVGLYFTILNSIKIEPKYFGLFLLITFSFISSSMFTVLLTHGAIVLLLISIFMLNGKKN